MIAYVDENSQITSTPPEAGKKTEVGLDEIEISIARKDPSLKEDSGRKDVVTYYSEAKGYGFIRDSQTKESVFVHINSAYDEIKEGHNKNHIIRFAAQSTSPTSSQRISF